MSENTRHAYPPPVMIFTAMITLVEVGSVVEALRIPADLSAQVSAPAALDMTAGVVWVLIFALATALLARGKPRAGRLTAWAVIAFGLYTLAHLMMFVRADYDRQRLPFLLAICGGTMLIPVLYLIRAARVKTMEKIEHGRESEY
jgi:hypothetical protein